MKLQVTLRDLFWLVVLFAWAAPQAGGDERHERVEDLIGQLASTNKPPPVRQAEVRLPKDYDKAAQVTVLNAFKLLVAEGEAALPQLIAHAGDTDYSASVASPSTEFNLSVGEMCQRIASSHIRAYEHHLSRGLGRWKPAYLVVNGKELQSWWAKHRKEPLWQLQVDAIDSALGELKRIDPEQLVENYHANSSTV